MADAPKTRYSDHELEAFGSLIQGKLDEARKQLELIRSQLDDLVDNPDSKLKGLGDATNSTESEQLTNHSTRLQKHIKYLEYALIRVENKVYGVCRETGKLISKERLMAVPHATLSIAAKEAR